MKKNKTVYITSYAAYTDKLMAEASAGNGNYLKANLAYVGKHVYALIKTMDYDGPYFHLNEVIKVFANLRSAVRSNEWKAAIADAVDIHEYGDCVMCTCCTDNIHYTIVAIDVYKGRYFRRKSFGHHTRLITSGLVDSRKIEYDCDDDGHFYTTAAFRPGTRSKNICHIFGYDVIETKDCYKVYNSNRMMFALPPDISYMGLISKVAAIDGYVVNGWWE